MSGSDGNRGYLVQTIIGVLELVRNDSDWESITIEPSHSEDQVDIFVSRNGSSTAIQVKSTVNSISLDKVKKWSQRLEESSSADSLRLDLVGQCSASVARLNRWGGVKIPSPKTMDIDGLLNQASHSLNKFLYSENGALLNPFHLELMVNALVTQLSKMASSGRSYPRNELVEKLIEWSDYQAITNDWEAVDFEKQRGIEAAISGQRLGPADIEACPKLPGYDAIVSDLEKANYCNIVGKPGCGKSVSIWQASHKYYMDGFVVWRPISSDNPQNLLENLPKQERSIVVIDDAQRFSREFRERIAEKANSNFKVVVSSTLNDDSVDAPSLFPAVDSVSILGKEVLERVDEIFPIVQRFDESVGNRYLQTSIEERIRSSGTADSPWEFFWLLGGGWKAAYAEYEKLLQIPHANEVLNILAIAQIVSCDRGVTKSELESQAATIGQSAEVASLALSKLLQWKLVISQDGFIRTKHLSYAIRVVEASLSDKYESSRDKLFPIFIHYLGNQDSQLQGIYWLLDSVGHKLGLSGVLDSVGDHLTRRCQNEWYDSDWAVACLGVIFTEQEYSEEELNGFERCILDSICSKSVRKIYFSGKLANCLINYSDGDYDGYAEELFNKIDARDLATTANNLEESEFGVFGDLLGRVSYYHPSWAKEFVENLDWQNLQSRILKSKTDHPGSVSSLVYSLSKIHAIGEKTETHLSYIEDIIPYIVAAIKDKPLNAISRMRDIFVHGLRFDIYFGIPPKPGPKELEIAEKIISQLDPKIFSFAICSIVSRDLEHLARSLATIKKINPKFVQKVAENIPASFYEATRQDWRQQTGELKKLLQHFWLDSHARPASTWIEDNSEYIKEPLSDLFAAISPETAVAFHRSGKKVAFFDEYHIRWNTSAVALYRTSQIDMQVAEEILKDDLPYLVTSMYDISIDEPRHIIRFFADLQSLFPEIYNDLLNQIDISCELANDGLKKLDQERTFVRVNYRVLALIASKQNGKMAKLGQKLLKRLRNG